MKYTTMLARLAWSLFAFAAVAETAPVAPAEEVAAQETEQETQEAEEDRLDVEDILANPLADEDYRQAQNCVWHRAIDDIEVLDDQLVVFRGRRGELWLNQLTSRCLGLDAEMLVNFRSYGGSVCRLDKFYGVPRFGSLVQLTAECRLGEFETIDELQVEALRRAIIEQRQASEVTSENETGASDS